MHYEHGNTLSMVRSAEATPDIPSLSARMIKVQNVTTINAHKQSFSYVS